MKAIRPIFVIAALAVVGVDAYLAPPASISRVPKSRSSSKSSSFVTSSSAVGIGKPSSSSSFVSPYSFSRLGQQQQRQTTTRNTASLLYASTSSSDEYDEQCDVLVLGSGPAARALATLLSSSGPSSSNGKKTSLNVILADKNYDKSWPPNYGVWKDEWESIVNLYTQNFGVTSLDEKVIDRLWDNTDCYFGGSFDIPTKQRFRIPRPYCRVDKDGLRDALSPPREGEEGKAKYKVIKANHISEAISVNVYSPAGSLVHDEYGSTIQLQQSDGTQMLSIRAKLIVDCTGHETKLVLKNQRDKSRPPGYQIAYGALVEIDESKSKDMSHIGPYDKEAMTLFDYRTDHFPTESVELRNAMNSPTFMYAMPLKGNKIFFEETSLVARPAMSFQECKDRCFQRLRHLGIKVVNVEEEEFCYIPMGGPLPEKNQRVIGFGGASAMVHPSTGYHLCRAMMGAGAVAKSIRDELLLSKEEDDVINLDRTAANAYHAIWSPSNIRQRNFAVFGGEFLMKQTVEGLRGFFDGFFRLPLDLWGGFLAGWPGLPYNINHETWNGRMWFGLLFISKIPLKVGIDMALSILMYCLTDGILLPQSVTPLLGEPQSYEYVEPRKAIVGDVAAKAEARRMIEESRVTTELPVAFGVGGKRSSDDNDGDDAGGSVDGKMDDGNSVVAGASSSSSATDEEEVVIKSFQ